MRRRRTRPTARKPKLVIHGIKHYKVRIKKEVPINSRTWKALGALPEQHAGTVTGEVHMKGLNGFLRVVWEGYPEQPTLINPAHVEEIA